MMVESVEATLTQRSTLGLNMNRRSSESDKSMAAGTGTQRRNKIRDEHGDGGAAVRFVLFVTESVRFVPVGVGWDIAGYQASRSSVAIGPLCSEQQNVVRTRVDIKVKMCCNGCERRVKSSISGLKGVKLVEVNRKQSRVTVKGQVEPKKILEGVLETEKKAEFWPYVPYNFVSYPYAAQAYDKKAPSGYVKHLQQRSSTLLSLVMRIQMLALSCNRKLLQKRKMLRIVLYAN
ncbi:hypothetical protein Drorol1_Dr00007844 [Drosera rotundifolia]